ncbi:cyclase [Halobiforma lacisalsi AJ5]|uniref:Cyclase n=1 Tax=Natronobacterium lacisalsi AJ5 TaxID=358396 RepID=M0LHP7_NATLA|nr:SRPBCC family protein [Halobiforma lacisalsi]APW98515.1 cyclase [Halobiforma lacisalsi AJ5]EMA33041.1 cyclase [Halobiforma lacisalsi AJ5]
MTADSSETAFDERTAPPDRRSRATDEPNVGRWERVASAAIGGALVVRGLRDRSLSGASTAAVGAALVTRGLTGRSRLYRLLDTDGDAGEGLALEAAYDERKPTVARSIIVGQPAAELTEYWRDPDHLDRIAGRFADVSGDPAAEERHHWRADAPLGRSLEWEALLVEDEPGDRLRWQSLEGAPIGYECTISFEPAPGDRGTLVDLEIEYDPPGGPIGDAVLSRFGTPVDLVAGESLRRFKSLAETGEIPSVEANPSGRGRGDLV